MRERERLKHAPACPAFRAPFRHDAAMRCTCGAAKPTSEPPDPLLTAIAELIAKWRGLENKNLAASWKGCADALEAVVQAARRPAPPEPAQEALAEVLAELRQVADILKAKPEQSAIDAAHEVMLALDLHESGALAAARASARRPAPPDVSNDITILRAICEGFMRESTDGLNLPGVARAILRVCDAVGRPSPPEGASFEARDLRLAVEQAVRAFKQWDRTSTEIGLDAATLDAMHYLVEAAAEAGIVPASPPEGEKETGT